MIWLLWLACQSPNKGSEIDNNEVPWRPPDTTGYYDAGLRTIEWVDSRGKSLTADVWYPARIDSDDELAEYEPTTLSISAYRNALPAVQEAPLIAFSHGFFAIRFQSAFLMEYLAQHGFVAIATDHPNNTILDFDDAETVSVLLERPDDIRASIDELERRVNDADDFLYGLANTETYTVIGHSFGSHTAMALGGGELDYNGLASYCEVNPNARPCGYLTGLDPNVVSEHGGVDERVVATIPMSPGLWYTFGEHAEGLASIEESLVIAGELDGVLGFQSEALPSYEGLGLPKILATVPGAGHYGFTDICLLAEALTPECGSMDAPEYVEIDEIKTMTKTLVTSYIGLNMRADDRYSAWLDPSSWDSNLLILSSE